MKNTILVEDFLEAEFNELYRFIKVKIDSNGKKKTPSDHKDWTPEQIKKDRGTEDYNYYSLAMKHTNYVCIDIDEEDMNYDDLPEVFNEFIFMEGNTKGRHYYVKLNEKPEWVGTENKVFKEFEGDLIGISMNGNNMWEKKNKEVFNIDINNIPEHDFDTVIRPLLKKTSGKAKVIKQKPKEDLPKKKESSQKTKEDQPKKIDTRDFDNNNFDNDNCFDVEFYKEIFSCFKNRWDNYDDWKYAAINIHARYGYREGNGLRLFTLFSENSSKYNKKENDDFYNNIGDWVKANNIETDDINDIFLSWAYADNQNKYQDIMDKYKRFNKYIKWEIFNDDMLSSKYIQLYLKNEYVTCGRDNKLSIFHYNGYYWNDISGQPIELFSHFTKYQKYYRDELNIQTSYKLSRCQHIEGETEKQCTRIDMEMRDIQAFHSKIEARIVGIGNQTKMKDIIEVCKKKLYNNNLIWNADPNLIQFENALFSLDKCDFIDTDPKYFINFSNGRKYDKTLNTEEQKKKIMQFISEILPNKDNKEHMEFLLKVTASILYKQNKEEHVYFFLSAGGSGKGSYITLCNSVFGEYSGTLDMSYFTTYDKQENAPNAQLFSLINSRLINSSEMPDTNEFGKPIKFNEQRYKKISGRDLISVRKLHSNDVRQFYPGKLIIQTNVMPTFAQIDDAIIRRTIIFEFPWYFTTDKSKKNKQAHHKEANLELKDLFQTNIYGQAFFEILIEYYKMYKKTGLTVPECIKKHTRGIFDDINDVKTFCESRLVYDEESVVSLQEILTEFDEYTGSKTDIKQFKKSIINLHVYQIEKCKARGDYRDKLVVKNYKLGYVETEEEKLEREQEEKQISDELKKKKEKEQNDFEDINNDSYSKLLTKNLFMKSKSKK